MLSSAHVLTPAERFNERIAHQDWGQRVYITNMQIVNEIMFHTDFLPY